MAILRAAATASFTLDALTPTLIDGLTLTPAADDYQLLATIEVDSFTTGGGDLQEFSVFVGGVLVNSSIRQIQEEASLNIGIMTIALNAKVSPNGSQAVEIRFETVLASDASTAELRELTLFPMPAAGTNSEDTDGADDTLATATFTTLANMTRTPPADDYLLIFTTDAEGPADVNLAFRVSVGGTELQHTHRQFANENSLPDTTRPLMIACLVSPNGSEVVEIEWSRVDGAGTITCHARTMSLVPVDLDDIVQATGTADDARTASGEILIDDMTITDPGADDWLVVFSAYDLGGTVGTNPITVMIHEGGAKVTDSDRRNDHDDSEDDTHLPMLAGGRVTIAGATDDLEMFWTLLPGGGPTFTIKERTLVAIREAEGASQISGTIPLVITPTGTLVPNAVDIWFKALEIQVPAAGDTVIDTTDRGTGAFGVHCAWPINTLDDTRQDDMEFGHGFSDGTNERAIMHNAEQGVSNTLRQSVTNAAILIVDPTSDAILVQGTLTLNANDVTIVWTVRTVDFRIIVEIWGGSDGGAVVGDVGADASPLTGLGLANGDLFLGFTSGEQFPASSIFAFQTFGCSHDNGASIDQWALLSYTGDNDEDFKGSALVEGIFQGQYDVDFADWQINITAQSGDGATWAGTNADHFAFMMLDLGGHGVDVGVFTKSTATAPASQDLPDLGFIPQGYSLATASEILQTTNVDRPARQSFGNFQSGASTGQSAIAISENQTNANSRSFFDTTKVLMTSQLLDAGGGSDEPDARAAAQAITDSTPTIIWDPNTTRADFIGYYALEQAVAAVSPIAGTIPLVLTPAGTIRADGELGGSADLLITPAGTIRADGELTGSADLLITPAGTIRGIGQLAGASDLAIALAGNLQADGELAGSADMVFDLAGTLRADALIAGTVDLTLIPSATLTALGELIGSADLVLTPAGTLRGIAELAGGLDLLITPAGTLQARGALAGSADLIITPAGTLTALGELVGASALVISADGDLGGESMISGAVNIIITPAGTIQATGALAGSADLVLTPAATIQALGALLGSAALVLTPAGTIGAQGALSGAVALLLTPAGALQARGQLTGTAALILTLDGEIAGVGANLAGEIPLVLTAIGTLEGLAALAGATTITITPSGALQAEGGILGTASLTLSLAGNLGALGELLGSSDLILSPAGNLAGLGQLTGSADLVLAAVGALGGGGALAGTVPLTLAAAGALLARGALSGGLTMTLTPSGTIRADASIAGSADLTFTLDGQLTIFGDLSGSIDMTIDAAGNIIASGELAGSADLAITADGTMIAKAGITGSAQLTLAADGTLRAIGELNGLAQLAFTLAGTMIDQSARRIPNSIQTFLVFLQNSRQDLSAGELNSDQAITSGRTNSSQ